jgi:hypothetical protein
MRALIISVIVAVLIAWAAPGRAQTTPPDCNAARCAVQTAVNQNCPCDSATNHGRYVSCVAHQVNTLARTGEVPKQCKGKVKRCAARSTCGKANFETCLLPGTGTCDTGTATCTEGTSASGSCTSAADCVVTSCRIMRAFPRNTTPVPGTDKCTLLGGTPGTGTCCAGCP